MQFETIFVHYMERAHTHTEYWRMVPSFFLWQFKVFDILKKLSVTSVFLPLNSCRMAEALCAYVEKDRPFLGICLGLQLLFESSEENGPGKCFMATYQVWISNWIILVVEVKPDANTSLSLR